MKYRRITTEQDLLLECWFRLAMPKKEGDKIVKYEHDYSSELEKLESYLRSKHIIDENGMETPSIGDNSDEDEK